MTLDLMVSGKFWKLVVIAMIAVEQAVLTSTAAAVYRLNAYEDSKHTETCRAQDELQPHSSNDHIAKMLV